MKKDLGLKILLGFGIVSLMILGIGRWKLANAPTAAVESSEMSAQYMPHDLKFVEDFHLAKQDGHPFTLENLKGKWSLVYFGYTHCPDVCPVTLGVLTQFLKKIAQQNPEQAAQLQVIFVSVDPGRDPIEHLNQYVAFFQGLITGVTGPEEELKRVIQTFETTFDYADKDQSGSYVVHHPTSIFIVNPLGQYVGRITKPVAVFDFLDAFHKFSPQIKN